MCSSENSSLWTGSAFSLDTVSWINEDPNLRCQTCMDILSVGPIFLQSNGKNVCGRCENSLEKSVRNFAYEAVASKLVFPCINNGCLDIISWQKVKSHEETCSFKPEPCFISSCNSRQNWRYLRKHFLEKHKDLYLEDSTEFKIDELKLQPRIKLLNFSLNMIFKVLITYDPYKSLLKFNMDSLGINLEEIQGITICLWDSFGNVIKKKENNDCLSKKSFNIYIRLLNILSVSRQNKLFFSINVNSDLIRLRTGNKNGIQQIICYQCYNSICKDFRICMHKRVYCRNCECSNSCNYTYISSYNDHQLEAKIKSHSDNFISCQYKRCPYEIKENVFQDHLIACHFKEFHCGKCKFLGNFEQLKNHYINYHETINSNNYIWLTELNSDGDGIEMVLNLTIFSITYWRGSSRFVQFKVNILFFEIEEKHTFRIELQHPENQSLNLAVEGVRQKSSSIGTIDITELEEYRNKDQKFSIKITIKSFQ